MNGDPSLPERRRELVERSAAQRAALIAIAGPFVQKAALADRIFSRVRRYPGLVAAVAGAAVFFGSRRLFDVASRILTLYTLFRR